MEPGHRLKKVCFGVGYRDTKYTPRWKAHVKRWRRGGSSLGIGRRMKRSEDVLEYQFDYALFVGTLASEERFLDNNILVKSALKTRSMKSAWHKSVCVWAKSLSCRSSWDLDTSMLVVCHGAGSCYLLSGTVSGVNASFHSIDTRSPSRSSWARTRMYGFQTDTQDD